MNKKQLTERDICIDPHAGPARQVICLSGGTVSFAPKPPRQASPATPPKEGNYPRQASPAAPPEEGKHSNTTRTIFMRNTKNYKSLPFNPALKDRAKALRKAGILHEALLWLELKNKKLNGLDFDRQKIIGNYIVDFYCTEKSVVIEVDGSSHDNKQDEDSLRDEFLNSLGLTVIRILAKEVLQNLPGVVGFLTDHPALRAPLQGRGINPTVREHQWRGIDPVLNGARQDEGNHDL